MGSYLRSDVSQACATVWCWGKTLYKCVIFIITTGGVARSHQSNVQRYSFMLVRKLMLLCIHTLRAYFLLLFPRAVY